MTWQAIVSNLVSFLFGILASFVAIVTEPGKRALTRWLLVKGPSPITMNVTSNSATIWPGHPNSWLGQSFYVPHWDSPIQPPGTLLEWPDWIKKQGGAAEGELLLLVTLVCDQDTTVVVKPPSVSVERRDVNNEAVKLRYQPQGGATAMPTVTFDVNLSGGFSMVADDPRGLDMPLSWSLSKGESQQFLIRAKTEGEGIYSWTLQLPLIVAGRVRIMRVDDHGDPFETAKLTDDHRSLFWAGGEWRN